MSTWMSMEVIVTIVSKLVYNLLKGLITYLYRGYNPVTKYHGHPSRVCKRSSGDRKSDALRYTFVGQRGRCGCFLVRGEQPSSVVPICFMYWIFTYISLNIYGKCVCKYTLLTYMLWVVVELQWFGKIAKDLPIRGALVELHPSW